MEVIAADCLGNVVWPVWPLAAVVIVMMMTALAYFYR